MVIDAFVFEMAAKWDPIHAFGALELKGSPVLCVGCVRVAEVCPLKAPQALPTQGQRMITEEYSFHKDGHFVDFTVDCSGPGLYQPCSSFHINSILQYAVPHKINR
jgi:hypothetical protein